MRIIFKTVLKECPDCNKTLKAYRTEIRHVISADNIFTAVHRIEKCRKCMKLFRSEALDKMIEPYCTYANDIMIDVNGQKVCKGNWSRSRKRTGNLATGRLLSHNGDKLAIFQNMGIPDYMKIVFGSTGVATRFASYRKGLRKHMNWAMTRKKMLELVDKGMEGLKSGTLRKDPYSDELMEMSFPAEKTCSVPGV